MGKIVILGDLMPVCVNSDYLWRGPHELNDAGKELLSFLSVNDSVILGFRKSSPLVATK